MQCPNCFAQLPEGSASCGYCGCQLYSEMQYTPDYSNQQSYYNQGVNQEYPNYPGSGDMNQYNQYDNQAQPQNPNQYVSQGQDYNQYNQYDNQAQTPDYNQYNQNVIPQPGYENYNMYNQQATPYQAAAAAPQPTKSGNGKSNKIIIISVIAVAIIAIIIGLVLILGGDKDKDKKSGSGKTTEATTTEEPTTEATTTEATTTEATTTEATTTEEPTTEATTEAVVTSDGYNGKYVFTHYDEDGVLIPASEVADYTGSNLDMYLMVYDNTCLLLSATEEGKKVYCDITIQDGVVTLDDGQELVNGTYNEEEQTIRIMYNNSTMVYTLDPGDGTTYDMVGDYSLAYSTYGTEIYTLEQMRETMGDSTYDMTLKVYGVICTLTAFENGSINIASTSLEAIGTDLYFKDGEGAIMGKYNPDDQTITMYTSGVDLVFELDTAQ